MAQRYARLDVEFFHKNTAQRLLEQHGPWGPLVFVALILRAKDGVVPGTFTYSSDAVAWEKLGFDPDAVPFTLDEFFATLGRLKQSSRRRNGRVWNVSLTRYADWQKDARRYEEAAKKARSRAHSTGDTQGTQPGTRKGQEGGPSSTSTSIGTTGDKKKKTKPLDCPHCGAHQRTRGELDDHIRYVHFEIAAAA